MDKEARNNVGNSTKDEHQIDTDPDKIFLYHHRKGHIGDDELVTYLFVYKIHIIYFCNGFPSMRINDSCSFYTIERKDFRLGGSVFAQHHFLLHHKSRSLRYLSFLSMISALKKNNICQDAKEQYLHHRKERKFETDLGRSFEVSK
jgi:hypothetical protein